MSLLRKLTAKNRVAEEPFNNLSLPPSWVGLGKVSRHRALSLAVVWACVRLRAETIGSLPVGVVEYDGASRVPKSLPPWLQKPNPEMTRFELMEVTSGSIDVDGNAFWWMEKDRLGRLVEVWPLPPTNVQVGREKLKDGTLGPKVCTIGNEDHGPDRVLHIPGFRLPGQLRGLNPIAQHAHSLGLAAAAEEYGERFFDNGATMTGVISHPGDPGRDGAERMRDTFAADHSGLRNAHKPGVLFGGATWTQLTIPNDQAQFLETRKFQGEEIARIFRVPAHKVNILDHATFSNIEHQAIEWVQDGVMPYTSRIEAAVLAAGLLDMGQHLRFNLNGLMRGDIASRYAAYAIGRQWGWLNVDDIRAREDENPLPDGQGQTYLEPLNMVPAGSSRDEATATALARAGVNPQLIESLTGVRIPQET